MKDKFLKMKAKIENMENILGYDSATDRFVSWPEFNNNEFQDKNQLKSSSNYLSYL